MDDFSAFYLTFKLALITTLILLFIGVPLAYVLSKIQSRFKPFFEAIVSLPLVLPPSVLGFYLLIALSPNSVVGGFLKSNFDINLVFSFSGLVFASVLYSLPFMVQPVQAGFEALPKSLEEASLSLGKSKFKTFTAVLLPNCKPALLKATVLTFAHTIGEFGVVLMIGGNIPGQTRVASIAIFDEVEALNYSNANIYASVLLAVSFTILIAVFFINHRLTKKNYA